MRQTRPEASWTALLWKTPEQLRDGTYRSGDRLDRREWSADVVVDEDLVQRLIAQFPELRVGSLRLFAEGWDNAVWLVNERWAFRFPRRAIAIPGVEREMAALPRLAPRLPRADPCIDLQLLWSFLPPAGRADFLDAYGPVTEAQPRRARALALSLSAALGRYGREEGMAAVEREAIEGLDRAASD